jgi:hypothetical protein
VIGAERWTPLTTVYGVGVVMAAVGMAGPTYGFAIHDLHMHPVLACDAVAATVGMPLAGVLAVYSGRADRLAGFLVAWAGASVGAVSIWSQGPKTLAVLPGVLVLMATGFLSRIYSRKSDEP